MIAGTVIIEDMSINFRLLTETERPVICMRVSVCDSMTGAEETYLCSPDDFAVALGIAMHPAGGMPDFDKTLETMAEKAMPINASLRWIP